MDHLEQAYRVLELELGKQTSIKEVNQAYKDLVFIWHPDRIPSDRDRLREKAEAKIKDLNDARALMKSHAKNGKVPAVSAAKPAQSSTNGARATARSRNGARSYAGSTYRPGDDSTYRPRRNAYSASYASNSRADGYRPPYETSRRGSYGGGKYDATYRARYPSSAWPRNS
ncbi:MAG: J domain-containing protein, partial [Cyanobacteria bacterium P01_F01_bin.3]